MSALFAELYRLHGPFGALMPSPYTGRDVLVRRRGGGEYRVRNLSTLRDGAVDLLDWGIAFAWQVQRAANIEEAAQREGNLTLSRLARATAMAAQQDASAALELSARWHKASNLPITRRDLRFEVRGSNGEIIGYQTVTNADELLALALDVRRPVAVYFLQQERAEPVVELAVELREPPASAMQGIVAASPLLLQGLIVLAGVVTVAWVLRTALAWIAPAARAQAEAHELALEQLERAHNDRLQNCRLLPQAEQAQCIGAANAELLVGLDEANRVMRKGQRLDMIVKVGAIVAIGALFVRGRRA